MLPNLTGQGFGCEVIQKSIEKLKQNHPNAKVELQVRSWNIRAIKCYQKCGFKILKTENIVDHSFFRGSPDGGHDQIVCFV